MNPNHDPAAHGEFSDPDRLLELWESAAPPEPSEATWAAVRARIEAGLAARASRRSPWLAALVLVPAAAAVLLALHLDLFAAEPFPVTAPEDVEIISVAGGDHGAVVVGQLPLPDEPMVLASHGDVTLESVQPSSGGVWPEIHSEPEDSAVPMIVVPLDGGAAKVP